MRSFHQLNAGETTAVEDTRDPRVFPTILRVKSPGYCKSPVYSKKVNDQLIIDLSCYPLIKTQCLRVITYHLEKNLPDQTNQPKTKLPKITKKITPRKFSRILKNPHFRNPWLYLFCKISSKKNSNLQSHFLLKGSDPYRILIKKFATKQNGAPSLGR